LNLGWVLMGDSAWREIHSKGLHRWLFWKNKPNWLHLSEPVSQLAPDEEVLKAAWQAGLQEQEDILAQWEHRS
jgi:hypothetical protein